MTPARPLYADDWPGLAAFAAQLRDQRAGFYPAGDARIERMAAIAAALAAIASNQPFDDAAIDWRAVRADLAATLVEANRRAADSPGNAIARMRADALAAIDWQFEPVIPGMANGTPNLLFCHDVTLRMRASCAADRTNVRAPAAIPAPRRDRALTSPPVDLFGAAA